MSESTKPPSSRERAYAVVFNSGDAYRSGGNGGEPLVAAVEAAINEAVEVERKANMEPWWPIVAMRLMFTFLGVALGVMIDQQFDLDNRVEHATYLSKSDADRAKPEADRARIDAKSCNDKLDATWQWTWTGMDMLASHDTIRGMPWQLVGSVDPGYGKPIFIYRYAGRRQ